MTKDYAKKRRPHVAPRRRNGYATSSGNTMMPAWAWMIAGLLLGLILSGAIYWKINVPFKALKPLAALQDKNTSTVKKQNKTTKDQAIAQANGPRFDFYTVLPNMTVDGPEIAEPKHANNTTLALTLQNQNNPPEKEKVLEKEMQTSNVPPIAAALNLSKEKASIPYIIQAGSFRQLSQAEELKAQLALSGFEASIQTFKLSPRDTRYRVFIGPFSTKDKADFQQAQLEQTYSLHSVVLKIGV